MRGSTSSSVYLVDTESGQFVLRVLDNKDWLAKEPDLIEHEAAALVEACNAGIRSPQLAAVSSEFESGPTLLMTFVAGEVELRPKRFSDWIQQLAGELATIHRHTADSFPWRYQTWLRREGLVPPKWSSHPEYWQEAIDLVQGPAPPYRPTFIHRDYHPTNVLWQDGKISGVVDWINACVGPAEMDVAHCRGNLALMYSPEAADEFLAAYQIAAPEFRYDPYWDLEAILDCHLDVMYYPPWRDFGLDEIAPDELRSRADSHLRRIVGRL